MLRWYRRIFVMHNPYTTLILRNKTRRSLKVLNKYGGCHTSRYVGHSIDYNLIQGVLCTVIFLKYMIWYTLVR